MATQGMYRLLARRTLGSSKESVVDTRRRAFLAFGLVVLALSLSTGSVVCADSELWVANGGGADVTVIDTSSNAPVSRIQCSGQPHDLAFTPDGAKAYVTDYMNGCVHVCDTATKSRVGAISMDCAAYSLRGISVTPDGRYAFAACRSASGGQVVMIDTASDAVAATITGLLDNAAYLAVTPDGSRVYVTLDGSRDSSGACVVAVIDVASRTVSDLIGLRVPTGEYASSQVYGVAITPDGRRAYVTEFSTRAWVVDTDPGSDTYNQTIAVINGVPRYGTDVAISRDGKYAYVSMRMTDHVMKIDTGTNSYELISIGPDRRAPYGIVVSPDGRYVYTANNVGNVSVIDTASNTVETIVSQSSFYFRSCAGLALLPLGGIPNREPIADAGIDQTIECSCQTGGTRVTLDGTGSHDPDGSVLTYTWTGPFAESPAGGRNPTVTLGCCGAYAITLVVSDGEMTSEPDEVVITVTDTTPPTITGAGSAVTEAEGPSGVPSAALLEGVTATDNCDPSPTLSNDAPGDLPLGDTIVTFTAADAHGNTSTRQVVVTVQDTTPPEITIIAPQAYGLYASGDLKLNFSAYDLVSGAIVPPDLNGTLTDTAQDQSVTPGCVPGVGVYALVVSAEDERGNRATSESVPFVVYDPEGGFVTGGGWIDSPTGAYAPDPSLSGKANFGFVSKYQKGANVPTGQTEFVFQAGDLNFHSTSYDWLVVTGSNFAKFKGMGSINDAGAYTFMLWAGDGPDTFRIKIWEDSCEEDPIYDNCRAQGDGVAQDIAGGSIVVHRH